MPTAEELLDASANTSNRRPVAIEGARMGQKCGPVKEPAKQIAASAARLSWPNDKGSNDRLLPTVACSTACRPPESTTSMR
jgi:hypothetical protein